MSRLLLISLTALATVSFTTAAQAQMRTTPDDAAETNEILSPNDNSPVNVVDPDAESPDAEMFDGGTRSPGATTPGRDENRTTEGNTILSPDDNAPVNVVNPGDPGGEADYRGVGGSLVDDDDYVYSFQELRLDLLDERE